jgi:formate hydrogenlyase subunit 3/multisubunit Na+/H+ antiporter MnhD subunit
MRWWQNLPFLLIWLPLASAAFTSLLPPARARRALAVVTGACCAGALIFLYYMAGYNGSYVYSLGKIGAPFGNELRAGRLEALMGAALTAVTFLCAVGGSERMVVQVAPQRQNLFCVMVELMLSALMVMTFTNDFFTAYVFIEIMTIAGCAMITARMRSKSIMAATRYMIMNLLGSSLFLFGLSMMYCLTGHLLMENIHGKIAEIYAGGTAARSLTVVIGIVTVGLAVKSALYPFHTWLPDAYATATPMASALLSSVVSKAYLFLLLKFIYRVVGRELFYASGISSVLYWLSLGAILIGSVDALREHRLRRMVAYSSVAQVGYIFLGLSTGAPSGAAAAIYIMIVHMVVKPMLFLASDKLIGASGGSDRFHDLRGAGSRAPAAGFAFTAGACAMVGIPLFGGFMGKIYLSSAALEMDTLRAAAALVFLALSTAISTAYFLKTVITIYRTRAEDGRLAPEPVRESKRFGFPVLILSAACLLLGIFCSPIYSLIVAGLSKFS